MRGVLLLFILPILLFLPILTNAKPILPKKMKSSSSEKFFHFHTDFPFQLCDAIVHEMYFELHRHSFHEQSGEDDIFETAGLAVCLGVMQNYTMSPDEDKMYYLKKAPDDMEPEDKDAFLMHDIEGTMVLKRACGKMTEDGQFAISETMYKQALTETPEQISSSLCPSLVMGSKKKDKAFNPKTHTEGSDYVKGDGGQPWPRDQRAFEKIMRERDTAGILQEMMEIEMHNPDRLMPEEAQKRLSEAKEGVRCQVCKSAVREAHAKAGEASKLPSFKDKWQRGSIVTDVVAKICHGPDYDKVNMGFFPTVAGNPPQWGEGIGVKQLKEGDKAYDKHPSGWKLFRYKGGDIEAAKERAAADMGLDIATYNVFTSALVRHVCRTVVDERQADDDLAELILDSLNEKPSKVIRDYCSNECASDTKARKSHWHDEL